MPAFGKGQEAVLLRSAERPETGRSFAKLAIRLPVLHIVSVEFAAAEQFSSRAYIAIKQPYLKHSSRLPI